MQVLHEGLADSKYRPCPLLVKICRGRVASAAKSQRGLLTITAAEKAGADAPSA